MTNSEEYRNTVFEEIRRYLPLKDHIRLGSIYSSWSAVARKRHYCLPYLVIQDPNKTSTRIYNLSHDKVYHHTFSDLYERYCCGSSHGWLVTIGYNLEVHLFDPFSKSQIKLPSLLPTLSPKEKGLIYSVAMGMCTTEEQMWRDFTVKKVILSADPRTSSDYIVTAGFSCIGKLAFWKPGASTWDTINTHRSGIVDMLWHKETLYVITMYDLLTFDVNKLIPIHRFSHQKEDRYLVELEGELHIVDRDVKFRIISFTVSKFNPENKQLTVLKSIGENALFLGGNHSMAIPSNEFNKCQSDSIYYTNNDFKWLHAHGVEEIANFHIKDGTISKFLQSEVYTPREQYPPIWLEAHPW